MAYQVSGSEKIKDDNTVTFKNVTVKNYYTFAPAYRFQGSTAGYVSGGYNPGPINPIDKFPFASDANATDVGDLTENRHALAGQSSNTSGYTSGGWVEKNIIDKFPFSVDANATDVGDLTVGRSFLAGQSSFESGYNSGGNSQPTGTVKVRVIDKFPFSSDANATDVGDLRAPAGTGSLMGQSSLINGYTSGGFGVQNLSSVSGVIEKFPFSSDVNSTDVGDLTFTRAHASGQSSTTHGYTSGGRAPVAILPTQFSNVIDKFLFSSDANATDVGDLTQTREKPSGQSSTTHGYASGGAKNPLPTFYTDVIDKFPFASDANATDVGDIVIARYETAGQQV